ncbi:MAG: hypothetical protein HKN58_02295, partial [Xanthomonadales bacterium]|nr:hypothetical protein [Xanthomonadales bacterium]
CTDADTPVSACEGPFEGTVIVDYTATDTNGTPASDEATLTIEVLPEPDEAISGLANPPEVNDPPVAGDDLSLTTMNVPVDGNWLGNDSDPNDAPGVDLADDDLTFEAYDFGDVPGTDAPVASFGPIDPDAPEVVGPASVGTATTEQGGTIEYFDDGTYTYTPPVDYVGPDKAIYRVCDESGACDVATIYLVVLPALDFGDLQQDGASLPPSSNGNPQAAKFKTTGTTAGRHFILPGLRLGATVDEESDGQPSNLADGDGADEDATALDAITPDESVVYRLGVEVTNNRAIDAIVTGWLDLNCDEDFDDAGERATGRATTATHDAAGNPLANASYSQTTSPVVGSGWDGPTANRDIRGQVVAASSGTQIVGLEWYASGAPLINQADVDNDCALVSGSPRMFARFRVTTDQGAVLGKGNRANSSFFSNASPTPNGPARDGEIEDHAVPLDVSTTPAMVVELKANANGGPGADVSWVTASELGAAAFRLERWVEAGQAGHWQRVHKQAWLPALLALQGGHYQVFDPEVREGESHRYRVMEQASKGKLIEHGPFDVTVGADLAPLDTGTEVFRSSERWDIDRIIALDEHRSRQQAKASARASFEAPTRTQAKPGGGKDKAAPQRIKLEVAETGVYGIPLASLAGYFGMSESTALDQLTAGQFRLSTGGTEVSWYADAAGTFHFYGEAIDSLYSANRIYWLADREKGTQMKVKQVSAASDAPLAEQIASVDFEENQFAFLTSTSNPEDDYWFWDFMFAINGFRERNYVVDLPDQRATAGVMNLRLFGNANVEHTLQLRVNGIDLDPVVFTGATAYEAAVDLPAEVFADGANEVDVTMTLDNSPGGLSSLFLDGFEITYTRGFEAFENRIGFQTEGATLLSGFDNASVVTMDVTAPRKPVWITGGQVVAGDGFSYDADLPLGAYAAAAATGLRQPVSAILDAPSDLASKNNRADYLIVTTDELWAGAEALAAYRSAEFTTMIVNQADVFDEFSHGYANPAALRELIRASRNWKTVPRYVVLLGDGSFDYQDRLGTGYNQVGPMMFGNRQGLHASDTLLGDIDGSGRPDVPVGRIPAKTVQEALDYVDKLAAYEANALVLPAMTVTDQPDKGGNFAHSGKLIAAAAEGGHVGLNMQGNAFNEVKNSLFAELNAGKRLVNYIGHGGTDRISKLGNGLLNNNDADTGLGNAFTPAFVGLSCLINNYSVPGWDSLGERLVMRPDAGMIATWAAAGESYNAEASLLGIRFNENNGQHERLG